MGNPPYVGFRMQDAQQKEDMEYTFKSSNIQYKKLDYISQWFFNGAIYIKDSNSKCAFVATNSICQGEHISLLWPSILKDKIGINFAYQSFKWNNNAKHNAAVICVIVGIANSSNELKYLYSQMDKKRVEYISPSLSDRKETIIIKRTDSISSFPSIRLGNMPNDNTLLRLTPQEYQELTTTYPDAHMFVRIFTGSNELINSIERYCIWVSDNDLSEAKKNPIINQRINAVYEYRIAASDVNLNKQAEKPHQFREFYESSDMTLVIPIVSSELRRYIPMGYVDSQYIVANSAFLINNCPSWIFGILTSFMHNVWVRATAGRLKSDFRYSTQLCYNTFPFPKINDEQKERLSALAENILLTRENHTEMTLGEMYNPESMPQDLKYAHQAMDIAVEQCYRPEPFTSDEERLEYLFKLYEKMTKKK